MVIHGLNLLPEKMLSCVQVLNNLGIDAFNVSLRGHGNNFVKISEDLPSARIQALKQVNHEIWSAETQQAYQQVRAHAQLKNIPILLLGFSLGAILGLELFLSHKTPFNRMILLAPPLAIHRRGYFIKLLRCFPQLILKSLSSPEYRSNAGTSVASYLALFQAISRVQELPATVNVPTLLFIDPKDQLVDFQRIPPFLRENHLTNWQICSISAESSQASGGRGFHHLLLDQDSVGKEAWEQMQQQIKTYLEVWEKSGMDQSK